MIREKDLAPRRGSSGRRLWVGHSEHDATGGYAAGGGMKLRVQITADAQGIYTAMCVSLPGCFTRAQTREKAQEQLHEVIRGYLAAVSNFVPENLEQELVDG
jgi:predicted RNase H-like HicB family nuclease